MDTESAVFSVDREHKIIRVRKTFAAPPKSVWAAWTESWILDKWWAPHPWKAKTKSMDFREGGSWLYAMVGPDGTEHWARMDFGKVDLLKEFTGRDSFCDSSGKVLEEFPQSEWKVKFRESANETMVEVEIGFEGEKDMNRLLEMGFREGFLSGLGNLDDVLGAW